METKLFPIYSKEDKLQHVVLIHDDVTEKIKIQDALIETQKLKSIGELITGLTHELNNTLTPVLGYTQIIMQNDLTEDLRQKISRIESSAKRSKEIVESLLGFGEAQPPKKEIINLNSIVMKTIKFLEPIAKANNVEIITKLAPDLQPNTGR